MASATSRLYWADLLLLSFSVDFLLRLCTSIRQKMLNGSGQKWRPIGTSREQGSHSYSAGIFSSFLMLILPFFRRGASPVYDARYILRPETVESIFLAYRLTGKSRYRKLGWQIFQSIQKHCRLEGGGYASILNVDDANTQKDDKMETFWLVRPFLGVLFQKFTHDWNRAKRSSIFICSLKTKVLSHWMVSYFHSFVFHELLLILS